MNKYNVLNNALNVALTTCLFSSVVSLSTNVFAAETATEKVEAASNKTVDAVKKTWRNAKDELCEMVDGKSKCFVKKVVNKIKSTSETIDTTAKEAKNKAD